MKQLKFCFMLLATCLLVACNSDDEATDQRLNLTTTFQLPSSIEGGTLKELTLTFKELNTGRETTEQVPTVAGNQATVKLLKGEYEVRVVGKLNYKDKAGTAKESNISGRIESFSLLNNDQNVTIQLFIAGTENYEGFVLAEIFCAGSPTPKGKSYYADKYFVIYNNTDRVLYADSLVIAESAFLTVMKHDYTPDIMATDFAVEAIYMVPGSGKDVPVKPGERLLIVDNAIDHTKANPNSWDETTADFEWYDESTIPSISDIDNTAVKNLNRIYCYTKTIWTPHGQGFKSYALARMKTTKDDYLTNYTYEYEYRVVGRTGAVDMKGKSYRIPNDWIIDAVNMSAPAAYQWLVTSPELDQGYAYSSEMMGDKTAYGKSVRRKLLRKEGGRAILQDTNNSSQDFEHRATANPFFKY